MERTQALLDWESHELETYLMERQRVMIVEDDEFTRAMVLSSLKLEGFDVVGDSASVRGAIRIMETLKPDIAIVDLHLGAGPTGLDLAFSFRLRHPRLAIVLLTTFDDPRLLAPNLPDLPFGAVYLVKRELTNISLLVKAIDRALLNVREPMRKEVKLNTDQRHRSVLSDVSDSQIETMRLLASGLSNREIAHVKGINEKSVEQSITRLASQLDISKNDSQNIRVLITKLYYQLTGSTHAATRAQ